MLQITPCEPAFRLDRVHSPNSEQVFHSIQLKPCSELSEWTLHLQFFLHPSTWSLPWFAIFLIVSFVQDKKWIKPANDIIKRPADIAQLFQFSIFLKLGFIKLNLNGISTVRFETLGSSQPA